MSGFPQIIHKWGRISKVNYIKQKQKCWFMGYQNKKLQISICSVLHMKSIINKPLQYNNYNSNQMQVTINVG